MKKFFQILVVIMILLLVLNACMTPSKYKWKVNQQPNTKWVSEDGTISLYVKINDNSIQTTGTICTNGELIDIYMIEGPARSTEMHIYPIDVLKDESISSKDKYEYWTCSYKSDEKFIATVKETTFFNVGDEITFLKTD